jgi:hypothetical protein
MMAGLDACGERFEAGEFFPAGLMGAGDAFMASRSDPARRFQSAIAPRKDKAPAVALTNQLAPRAVPA